MGRAELMLESRVPVSAHRLRDLKAAPEGTEIEAIEPVERDGEGANTAAGR